MSMMCLLPPCLRLNTSLGRNDICWNITGTNVTEAPDSSEGLGKDRNCVWIWTWSSWPWRDTAVIVSHWGLARKHMFSLLNLQTWKKETSLLRPSLLFTSAPWNEASNQEMFRKRSLKLLTTSHSQNTTFRLLSWLSCFGAGLSISPFCS